ncbi:hypothetical protein F4861DRAFT_505834 [Xylaria intraflava]|nr:hypothetical protein F4861DRAFT_505834 [Xylaria intraflava]
MTRDVHGVGIPWLGLYFFGYVTEVHTCLYSVDCHCFALLWSALFCSALFCSA